MQYRNVIHGSKRICCEKVLKQKRNLYDHPFERYRPKTGHDWRKNTTKKRLIIKLFDFAKTVDITMSNGYILFDVMNKGTHYIVVVE